MSILDGVSIEAGEATGMAGAKRINYASRAHEEKSTQLELWTLLGETRVVSDAAGTALVPWQAENRSADAPGRADAQIKRPGSATGALNLGKSGAAFPQAGAARNALTVAPARYGNRPVIRRRD